MIRVELQVAPLQLTTPIDNLPAQAYRATSSQYAANIHEASYKNDPLIA